MQLAVNSAVPYRSRPTWTLDGRYPEFAFIR
jgi:hypothetical protein